MRRKAKEVNFGIMYGIGPFGLANRLGISQTEAKDIIARYFERFPGVKQYIQDTLEQARTQGYVQTLHGRRRYLPEITSRNQNIRGNAERQAINMPIQGTAADMIKIAMVRLHAALRDGRFRSRLLLQVHDELICEVPQEEEAKMKELVTGIMSGAMPLDVPVKVDAGVGTELAEGKVRPAAACPGQPDRDTRTGLPREEQRSSIGDHGNGPVVADRLSDHFIVNTSPSPRAASPCPHRSGTAPGTARCQDFGRATTMSANASPATMSISGKPYHTGTSIHPVTRTNL